MRMENLFKHQGSIGDIIYSLPAIKACGGGGLWISKPSPYVNAHRLFESQSYIEGVMQDINGHRPRHLYNLDMFRDIELKHRMKGDVKHLAEYFLQFVDKEFDLSQPWLEVEKVRAASIVISRTHRYHDAEEIDWSLLKAREGDCAFVGWYGEFKLFRKVTGLDPTFYLSTGFLDIAQVIAGCNLFIGNQSACFAVAEALKVNRVLEVYRANPNCMPQSSNGHTELTKEILERYAA